MSSIYNLSSTEDNTNSDTVELWSDSDDDSLYNEFTELESQHEGIESTSNTVALTGPRIFALNQYEIVKVIEHDSKFESEFFSNINSLHSLLFVCDKAITILHNVSRDALAGTDASKEFVKGIELSLKHSSTDQDVAPKMDARKVVERFNNFKRVRFVVSYFVIHIRQLGIDILSEVEQLELFKGKNFVDVKGKIISALKINLDKCNAQVQTLNSTLNSILQKDYLRQIQIDLGLNRLDESTLKILEELDSLEKKQREKHVEIKCQLDKLKNCSDLISAAQKMLPHTHSNVESKESRIKKLAKTITDANEIIAKIPASASTPEYAQWLYWWSTKENCEKSENLKGTEDVDYYDSLTYVRKKGLFGSTSGDKKQSEKIRKDLTESYNVYNSKYKKAKEDLAALINPFTSTMGKFQFKIGILLKKLMESPQRDWNAIRYFGCIETFVKSIENVDKDGRSPFYSLITILKGIDTLISTDVELLSSEEKFDIFVAGKRLKKDAAFLIKFSEDLMYL